MNTSKLLFGLKALLHSLSAKPLQNILLLCQGGLSHSRTSGPFWLLPLARGGFSHCEGISWLDHLSISVLLLTSWSWHVGNGTDWASGCLCAPVLHGVYNTTWAWTVSKTAVLLSLCPPPGTGFRSEIISLKIVKRCSTESSSCCVGWSVWREPALYSYQLGDPLLNRKLHVGLKKHIVK